MIQELLFVELQGIGLVFGICMYLYMRNKICIFFGSHSYWTQGIQEIKVRGRNFYVYLIIKSVKKTTSLWSLVVDCMN